MTPPLVALMVAVAALAFPPCPTEDSRDCVWIGPAYGNHQGATFVDIGGTPYYLSEAPNS